LTDSSDPDIDKTLREQGYTLVEPTYVMEMDLHGREFPVGDCVMTNYADESWLNSYFTVSKNSDKIKMAAAKRILDNVKTDMICGRILKNDIVVACGTSVVKRGYMGLLNVIVDEQHRRKGYGIEVCESLLSASQHIGAHTAYLQVVQENHTAVKLYKKLGYKIIY
jgi:ribosomal protein S18 acetylase RimI-like enzyme